LATTELRVLLINVVESVNRWWPLAQVTLYVDDLTIAMTAAFLVATETVAEIVDFVCRVVHGVLRLEVSGTKSMTVGSRVAVARRVAQLSRSRKLVPKRAGKLLGAALGWGRRRSVHTLRGRIATFKRKLGRLHAFQRVGGNAAKYVRTAGVPSVTYAVDVTGLADSMLASMRSLFARASAPPGCGKSPDIALHFLDAKGAKTDPANVAHAMPALHWATAW
jgi:hypothetical protein